MKRSHPFFKQDDPNCGVSFELQKNDLWIPEKPQGIWNRLLSQKRQKNVYKQNQNKKCNGENKCNLLQSGFLCLSSVLIVK